SKTKAPPPRLGQGVYFDGAVSIMSRVYDPDRDRVISRAAPDGVAGMLCWSTDIDKIEALHKLCSANESLCYFMAGIHPDNVGRTNRTQQEAWHLRVDEFSRERCCVAVYSGLNLTRRDAQSHFAQESMLRCMFQQAKTLSVPLCLFVESKVGEGEEDAGGRGHGLPVIVMDAVAVARGSAVVIAAMVAMGFHLSVSLNEWLTGAAVEDEEALEQPLGLEDIPRDRLLLSSNSPHHTPLNIPDDSIRESKNEPSNFKFMVQCVAPLVGMSEQELAAVTLENSKRVFKVGGMYLDELVEAAASVTASAESSRPRKGSTDSHAEEAERGAREKTGLATVAADGPCYVCSKCSTDLFAVSQLVHRHALPQSRGDTADTAPSVLALPENGGCTAVHFLAPSSLSSTGLSGDEKGNISCGACAAKIGKAQQSSVDAPIECPCGYGLVGAAGVLRLTSSKVRL
ncbi:unnamed protein product, partial [Ectocarpus fasciculatus]